MGEVLRRTGRGLARGGGGVSKYTDPANKRDVAFWALLVISVELAGHGEAGLAIVIFLLAGVHLVAELRDRK